MQTYLVGLEDTAVLARDIDAALLENNASSIAYAEGAIESAQTLLDGAVSDCKVRRYGEAQDAKKGVDDWDAGK